jgi:hypothetical protein
MALNYLLYGGDAQDAFAYSPAPKVPTYVRIDDTFADRYHHHFGKTINCHQVLAILHALQGHPKAARLCEEHITKSLHDLGFKSTTHEHNIYICRDATRPILLLHQVDDFAIATHC